MPTLHVFCASSGGARGAFQGGVLEALCEAQIELHGLVGVSTGAIQAGYVCQAAPGLQEQTSRVQALKDLWFGLKGDADIYDQPFGGPVVSLLLGRPGVYRPRPLSRLLDAHVRDSPRRPVRLGVVDLASGAFEVRDPGTAEDLRTSILASSSIPFAFPPVARSLVDGGVRELAPLDLAFELAAEMKAQPGTRWDSVRVFLALASPRRVTREPRDWSAASAFEIGQRALDLLQNENYVWDVESALRVNELLQL